jgi:hypothetical protein
MSSRRGRSRPTPARLSLEVMPQREDGGSDGSDHEYDRRPPRFQATRHRQIVSQSLRLAVIRRRGNSSDHGETLRVGRPGVFALDPRPCGTPGPAGDRAPGEAPTLKTPAVDNHPQNAVFPTRAACCIFGRRPAGLPPKPNSGPRCEGRPHSWRPSLRQKRPPVRGADRSGFGAARLGAASPARIKFAAMRTQLRHIGASLATRRAWTLPDVFPHSAFTGRPPSPRRAEGGRPPVGR